MLPVDMYCFRGRFQPYVTPVGVSPVSAQAQSVSAWSPALITGAGILFKIIVPTLTHEITE